MLDDKDLKKQILNSVDDDNIPDLSMQIKKAYQNKKASKPWYKKGITWAIGTPILALGAAACVGIVVINNNNSSNNQGTTNITPVGPSIIGKKNQIAFGIMSMNNVLTYSNDASINNNSSLLMAISKQDLSQQAFEDQINYLNPYMLTSEAMLNNQMDLEPVVTQLETGEYQFMMEINAPGQETLIFKYNETQDAKTIDLEEDEEDEEDEETEEEKEQDIDDDNEEQEYQLNGQVIQGESIYYVEGEKEFNATENEFELELSMYEDKSLQNLVMSIQQEFETSGDEKEQSYECVKYDKGKKIFSAEISFEQEGDELAVDIELLIDNIKSEYKIQQSKNNDFDIDYVYDGHSSRIKVNIMVKPGGDPNQSYYAYTEANLGYTVNKERN